MAPKQFYKLIAAARAFHTLHQRLATMLCSSKHVSYHPLENTVGVFSDSYLNTQEQSA